MSEFAGGHRHAKLFFLNKSRFLHPPARTQDPEIQADTCFEFADSREGCIQLFTSELSPSQVGVIGGLDYCVSFA